MDTKEIRHLYLRAGFGIGYDEMTNLASKTRKELVDSLFSASATFTPLEVDLSEFDEYFNAKPGELKSMYNNKELQELKKKSREKVKELNYAWIERLAAGNEVLREKMTLFWANLFVCKDNNIRHIQQYNNTLRSYALGNFGEFIKAVAKEPSMSKYLNNKQNVKESPNENFARELMELFTLGIGNYTEQDIKESARAFTGWSFRKDGSFFLRRKQHDYGEKTFMGKTGNFDGDDIIDIILEQKQCARFICTKIYKYFVNPVINSDHTEELASLFYKDYDINKLMYHIFTSEWFYDKKNIGVKIKSPVELLTGIRMTVPVSFEKKRQLLYLQKMMGQTLLEPPNVAGWKGDKNWIDSNTLMFRLKLPSLILNDGNIDMAEKGEPQDSFEDYYKINRKKPMFFKTSVGWDNFEKEYAKPTPAELQEHLVVTELNKGTRAFLSGLKTVNIREHIVQLMSLPEYQLC